MKISEVTIEVKLRWWFLYLYIPLLGEAICLSRLVNEDVEPNWDRLEYWLKKAIVVKK